MALELKELTETIDRGLNHVTTHKTFLKTVGLALNINVYRKRWTRRVVEKTLISLELPLRSDQARLLSMIQNLQDKVDDLEAASKKSQRHVRS
jgi:hypothetical protein